MNAPRIRLQQTLHGYDGGHRLLSASLDLPPTALSTMLPLSDAADADVDERFGGLLSVYPLPDAPFTVVAKTWPAPEMPRPGCVWTHSILISHRDLPRFEGPERLLSLFDRPRQGVASHDAYSREIEFDIEQRSPVRIDTRLAATVLWSLCEPPVQPTAFAAETLEDGDRELLLLLLWGLLWPRLARGFCFAEAPAELRTLRGKPFDLLATSRVAGTRFERRANLPVRFVGAVVSVEDLPAWSILAAEALTSRPAIRAFLAKAGDEAKDDRTALPGLVEIASLIDDGVNDDAAFRRLLHAVLAAFPYDRDMPKLKLRLFGDPRQKGGTWSNVDEVTALSALCELPVGAISTRSLNIKTRVGRLWAEDLPSAQKLLANALAIGDGIGNEGIRGEVVEASAEAIVEQLDSDGRPSTKALVSLVEREPAIASHSRVWTGSKKEQQKLWKALRDQEIDAALRSSIVRSALDAQADDVLPRMTEAWPEAVDVIARLALSDDRHLPQLRQLARSQPGELSEWLEQQPRLSVENRLKVAAALAPSQLHLLSDKTLEVLAGEHRRHALEPSLVLGLLGWCLTREGRPYDELCAILFQSAYRAAADNKLTEADQSFARSLGGVGDDWDLARRLASRLSARFAQGSWRTATLLEIKEREAFNAVIEAAVVDPGSEDVITDLVQLMKTKRTGTAWQQDIVMSTVSKSADRSLLVVLWEGFWDKVR